MNFSIIFSHIIKLQERKFTKCIRYTSTVVIKNYDQDHLQKKVFSWLIVSEGKSPRWQSKVVEEQLGADILSHKQEPERGTLEMAALFGYLKEYPVTHLF